MPSCSHAQLVATASAPGVLLLAACSKVVAVWGCWPARVQVLRGYVGDRGAKPVFQGSTPFDILGTGYQRPFELATLRLFNMAGILPKCKCAAAINA